MHSIEKTVEDFIFLQMEGFSDDILDNKRLYITYNLSVFTHWLTEKEAEDILSKDGEHHKDFERKILFFYEDIFKNYNVYAYFEGIYGPSCIVQFDTFAEYKSHILLNIKEKLFSKILIPELGIVLSGNYDYTHQLSLRKTIGDLDGIKKLVKTYDLHII